MVLNDDGQVKSSQAAGPAATYDARRTAPAPATETEPCGYLGAPLLTGGGGGHSCVPPQQQLIGYFITELTNGHHISYIYIYIPYGHSW